jgi:hypothetical protein
MQSMVEGACGEATLGACEGKAPSTTSYAGGPPPRAGAE